jgi:hypothetical protein
VRDFLNKELAHDDSSDVNDSLEMEDEDAKMADIN